MTNVPIPLNAVKVGEISDKVKTALKLDMAVGTPIYIGQRNIEHMEREHPVEFERYFERLPQIIASPDYVGINQKDGSIEYIKNFPTYGGKFLKLAVRISKDNFLFARSLYEIFERTVRNREKNGTLKPLTQI